jgi:FkbM family methyltransferase
VALMPIDRSAISGGYSFRRALRAPFRLLPRSLAIPIRQGPARGMKWIVGAGIHDHWLGTYEPDKQSAILRFAKAGMTFYDVGAHAGFYTLMFSRLAGDAGRVYAFEPLPSNVAALLEHLRLNSISNAWVIDAAAGDRTGMAGFTFDRVGTMNSLTSDSEPRLRVATLRLDDAGLPPADLIKIDVEGTELAVLKGAERALAARHPILFVALDGLETRRECLTFLSGLGYDLFMLDGSAVSGEPDEIYALPR